MSVTRRHEGIAYHFASRGRAPTDTRAGVTYAGHPIGWGDAGVAPRPEYPVRVVARGGEILAFPLQGRTLKTEREALAFVQRCRNNCVLLDARQRFVGAVFRDPSLHRNSWSREILLQK